MRRGRSDAGPPCQVQWRPTGHAAPDRPVDEPPGHGAMGFAAQALVAQAAGEAGASGPRCPVCVPALRQGRRVGRGEPPVRRVARSSRVVVRGFRRRRAGRHRIAPARRCPARRTRPAAARAGYRLAGGNQASNRPSKPAFTTTPAQQRARRLQRSRCGSKARRVARSAAPHGVAAADREAVGAANMPGMWRGFFRLLLERRSQHAVGQPSHGLRAAARRGLRAS